MIPAFVRPLQFYECAALEDPTSFPEVHFCPSDHVAETQETMKQPVSIYFIRGTFPCSRTSSNLVLGVQMNREETNSETCSKHGSKHLLLLMEDCHHTSFP